MNVVKLSDVQSDDYIITNTRLYKMIQSCSALTIIIDCVLSESTSDIIKYYNITTLSSEEALSDNQIPTDPNNNEAKKWEFNGKTETCNDDEVETDNDDEVSTCDNDNKVETYDDDEVKTGNDDEVETCDDDNKVETYDREIEQCNNYEVKKLCNKVEIYDHEIKPCNNEVLKSDGQINMIKYQDEKRRINYYVRNINQYVFVIITILIILISYKANTSTEIIHDKFMQSIINENLSMLQQYIDDPEIDITARNNEPIKLACHNGNIDVINILLNAQRSNIYERYNINPDICMNISVTYHKYRVVEYLLQRKGYKYEYDKYLLVSLQTEDLTLLKHFIIHRENIKINEMISIVKTHVSSEILKYLILYYKDQINEDILNLIL